MEKGLPDENEAEESIMWQTMIEWMDEKLKPVAEMLTRNHHKIVR